MHTAKELSGTIVEMVTMPDIYIRIQSLIDDPDMGLVDIADAILYDIAISARLLKLANSSMFNFNAPVDTVMRAVNMLGPEEIHDLVLTTCVTRAFGGKFGNSMNIIDFWRNGARCASLCNSLAARCNKTDSERLFVQGLLHAIGHMVMYQVVPEDCQLALYRSQQSGLPLYLIEREIIGCDYADLGGELLQSWHIPETLHLPIRYHIEPENAEVYPIETSIVHIASHLSRASDFDVNTDAAVLNIDDFAWRATGLDLEDCVAASDEAEQSVAEILTMIQAPDLAA